MSLATEDLPISPTLVALDVRSPPPLTVTICNPEPELVYYPFY
jgi:hypothetical protein